MNLRRGGLSNRTHCPIGVKTPISHSEGYPSFDICLSRGNGYSWHCASWKTTDRCRLAVFHFWNVISNVPKWEWAWIYFWKTISGILILCNISIKNLEMPARKSIFFHAPIHLFGLGSSLVVFSQIPRNLWRHIMFFLYARTELPKTTTGFDSRIIQISSTATNFWFGLLYFIIQFWQSLRSEILTSIQGAGWKECFQILKKKKVKMSRKIFLALAVVLCIQQVNCHMSNKFEPSDYVESDHTFANKRCKIIVLSLAGTWSTTGWGRPARARGRARTGQGRQCRQCPSEGNNLIFSASL